jgi:seryl-tRNA synthetase
MNVTLNDRMNDMNQTLNDRIDDLRDRMDEFHGTLQGILQALVNMGHPVVPVRVQRPRRVVAQRQQQ